MIDNCVGNIGRTYRRWLISTEILPDTCRRWTWRCF